MRDGLRTVRITRQSGRAASSPAGPRQSTSGASRSQATNSQDARTMYERYLALAHAKALAGDRIEAEKYYQHAEHYLRSIGDNES
jgi:hypothetical protein